MKIGKKALALVLALTMVVSTFFSTAVFAAKWDGNFDVEGIHYHITDSNLTKDSTPVEITAVNSGNDFYEIAPQFSFNDRNFNVTAIAQHAFDNTLAKSVIFGAENGGNADYSVFVCNPDDENPYLDCGYVGLYTNGDGHYIATAYPQPGYALEGWYQEGIDGLGNEPMLDITDNHEPVYAAFMKSIDSIALDKKSMVLTTYPDSEFNVGYLIPAVSCDDDVDCEMKCTSSDESAATVEAVTLDDGEDGYMVTAKSKGTATITVSAGSQSATCTVTVVDENIYDYSNCENNDFQDNGHTIEINEKELFTWNDAEGTVSWSSSQQDVATVDENGVVTALKGGRTFIKATCGSVTKYFKVTVEDHSGFVTRENATGAKILYDTLSLYKAGNFTLGVYYTKEGFRGSKAVESENISYSSSNLDVATVDKYGNVTGVEAGEAEITATVTGTDKFSNTPTLICKLTVFDISAKKVVSYSYDGKDFPSSQTISFDVDEHNSTDKVYLSADVKDKFDTTKPYVYFKLPPVSRIKTVDATVNGMYELAKNCIYFKDADGSIIITVPMKMLRAGSHLRISVSSEDPDVIWDLTHNQANATNNLQAYAGVYQHGSDKIEIGKNGEISYNGTQLNKNDFVDDDTYPDDIDQGYGWYSNYGEPYYRVAADGTVSLYSLDLTAVKDAGAHWDTYKEYYVSADNGYFKYNDSAKTLTYYAYNWDGDIPGAVYTLAGSSSKNSNSNSNSAAPAANTRQMLR